MHGTRGAARFFAVFFFLTTVALAIALGLTLDYLYEQSAVEVPPPPAPPSPVVRTGPVSPLLVSYQLHVPGRGEIFPALFSGNVNDYWPVAVLTVSNSSDQPITQQVTAEVLGWSARSDTLFIVAPRETRKIRIIPELLPRAYDNSELRRATLRVEVNTTGIGRVFSQTRPVFLHSASDFYWGDRFSNAQFIARWVTPHDPIVLRLVATARRYIPEGRFAGYSDVPKAKGRRDRTVPNQARAVFEALRRSGISYVSSIFTFGSLPELSQRIRLPRETLFLNTANCIDVSVAFASAMENVGLAPVIVIVPGHAFAGVRTAPNSSEILYVDLTVLPRGTFEQAVARAETWLKKTAADKVLTVDVAAVRSLGIYPLPTGGLQAAAGVPPASAEEPPISSSTTKPARQMTSRTPSGREASRQSR
ncbi:MAG: hypothetical protein L0Z53_19355 [Acidobacteriales bacterium]|nr:hypothetical protein [Terriglobales bacterium]